MNPVEMYNEIVNRVPAYQKFLQEQTGGIPKVQTMEDLADIPLMDKASYILKHPIEDLCLDGNVNCAHLWLRSSGTSRKPFFWPRRYEDEKNFPQGMRKLFHDYTASQKQPTLIIVGLALGPWGTGMQSSYAFRVLARETPGLALCSPGLNNDNILEVLERLSPNYSQTLLLSYPPFAKNVLEQAEAQGMDLPGRNIHVMVGGEGITEKYREHMWKLLGHTEKDLNTVWCLYGSTDFANVGFENPLTIAIRRILTRHGLCREILGEPAIPMFFQRAPLNSYFEEVNGELVVSRIQGIPLMRYRSGDHVRFMPRSEMLDRLRDHGHDAEQVVRDAGLPVPQWNTPFVALYGRIDQTLFFYGANITLDQIKSALESEQFEPYFNGRYLVRMTEDEHSNPQIEISLPQSQALETASLEHLADIYADEFAKVQSEFRQVREQTPGLRHVRIVGAPDSSFELGWKTRHM